jgi:organic radical activating enzyme
VRKLPPVDPRLSSRRRARSLEGARVNVIEIFSSFQGEGLWAGARQVFVRLGICHLRCVYCDTPESWTAARDYRVEREPMSKSFETRPNPATTEEVLRHVERLASPSDHSVSITGGEPLLQVERLEELLPALKRPVYLETSGTLSDRLARIAAHVRYFSLDFKPPSTPGVEMDWEDFERCVRIASGSEAQVKVVVLRESPTIEEVERLCAMLHGTPLVFTPVTPVNSSCEAPGGDRLRLLREVAEKMGVRPHVIPQIHPMVGWL